MKIIFWAFLFSCFLLIACHEPKPTQVVDIVDDVLEVPEIIVEKSKLNYIPKTSLWTLNDLPYSGFAVSYYPDSSLMEKFGIVDGKKQNEFIQWYPDGHLKNVSDFHLGKLHGSKKMWSPDSIHILLAHFKYETGKAHGEQKKWYSTGELYKILNMHKGKEVGMQQAFRKNGDLYANYEARDGRIFGLKKAALCFGLEDESVQFKK